MTINEMIKEMKQARLAINKIGTELKYTDLAKFELFKMRMNSTATEWIFNLEQRVISNHKKAEIELWYNQSQRTLTLVKRLVA